MNSVAIHLLDRSKHHYTEILKKQYDNMCARRSQKTLKIMCLENLEETVQKHVR